MAVSTLPEVPRFVPRLHMGRLTLVNFSSKGSKAFFWPPGLREYLHTRDAHAHTQAHTHTYKIKQVLKQTNKKVYIPLFSMDSSL